MYRSVILWIVSLAALLAWNLPSASCAEEEKKEKDAVIVSPKEGAKVSSSEEVEGKLNIEGWPVILVQPLVEGEPWWIQGSVEELDEGKFTTTAQFGNTETKAGTKFKIIIVVAKNQEAAKKFEKGKTRTALPAGLPRSAPVTVVRGD